MAIADLPTLAEISAHRRAIPKAQLATRLDEKTKADRDDAKKLAQFSRAVKARDGGRCRVPWCHIRTITTLELCTTRGEAHHLRSRTSIRTRHDSRNGIWVCKFHHDQLTRHQLFVTQTAARMFTVGRGITAKSYLNGDEELTFSERHP